MSAYLGLDIGTSAVKAALLDGSGAVRAAADSALAASSPRDNWSEQNPDDWVAAAAKACKKLRRHRLWRGVRAVGLSGQMHGAVCLNARGRPLRPAILWNDGRSARECQTLRAAANLESIAGVDAAPGFTAPKILWMSKNEKENFRRIRHILLPKDYVRLYLTGEFATDCSDAAGTLWLAQKTRAWHPRLCEISRTNPAWLPRVLEGVEESGRVTKKAAATFGLPPGAVVAAGGGDAATGAVGAGAVTNGDSFFSLGTSGQLFVCANNYKPPRGGMVHAFAHCLPRRWFYMATMLNGASPLAWWSAVCEKNIGALLAEAAAEKETARMPLFLPYLSGERTPHNDARIRAAFYGMEAGVSRAMMTRAVAEAVAFCFADAKRAMADSGLQKSAALIGGGAKSDFLAQLLAAATATRLTRRQDAHAGPALGAARLAMMADGASTSVAAKPAAEKTFAPRKDDELMARYARWRRLYKTLRPFAADVSV